MRAATSSLKGAPGPIVQPSRLETLLHAGLLGIGYYLAAVSGIAWLPAADGGALICPQNAIAAALMIRYRDRYPWIASLCAVLLAAVLSGLAGPRQPMTVTAALACVQVAEVALMVWVYRCWSVFPNPNLSVAQASHMTAFFGLGIPALGAVSSSLVARVLAARTSYAVLDWWLPQAFGACLFGPAIILYGTPAVRRLLAPAFVFRNVLLAVVCLASCYVSIRYVQFPFAFIALPLLIGAFNIGGMGTAFLVLLCGLTIAWLWVHDIRPGGLERLRTASSSGLPVWAILSTLMPATAVGLGSDDRRASNKALRASERRFRESLDRSPIGMVMIDLDGRWLQTNIAMRKMLGYTAQEFATLSPNALIHPDEHADIAARRLKLRADEIDSHNAERRFLHKSGTWIWTRAAVSLVRDEEQRPMHFVAQIENIEIPRAAEQALANERETLKTTLGTIAEAVVTTDAQRRITYVNAAAEALLGLTLTNIQGRPFNEVIALTDPVSLRASIDLLAQCIAHGTVARREEACILHRPDGSVGYVLDSVSPVFAAHDSLTGTVIVLRDASAHYQREQELRHRATHDALTGLLNRFEFQRRAKQTFDRTRLLGIPAAILAIDLDRFKAVNDAAGHAAGDAVLRAVSAALASTVRSGDFVARLGGDEFAIMLEKCPPERADALAAQLLRTLNPLKSHWEGVTYTIGASIGVAVASDRFLNESAWLEAADRACYEAKRRGRGRVEAA